MGVLKTRCIKINQARLFETTTFVLFFKELGRAFQSLAALTLNERPPSDSRLKQGQTKFNEPYLLFLSLMSEFNMVKMVSDTCTLFSCYRSLPLLNFSILKRNKKKTCSEKLQIYPISCSCATNIFFKCRLTRLILMSKKCFYARNLARNMYR